MTVTEIGMLVVTIGIVGWDIYLALNKVKGDTISETTWRLVGRRAIIPFGAGVVCGHLFW